LPFEVLDEFRSRWTEIQAGLVDTPREAVERADELVAEAIKRLAESFAQERARLEAQMVA
jgi:methionine synthase II (cobalamin-independent)